MHGRDDHNGAVQHRRGLRNTARGRTAHPARPADADAQVTRAPAVDEQPPEPLQVLLVDDEPRVLRGLYRLLQQKSSLSLHIADGGEQALELLATDRFDVVVTDLHMPEMDGLELLRLTRDRHPQIVRILLSGSAEDIGVRCATIGHQFLSKPCDPNEFTAVLQRAGTLRPLLRSPALRQVVGRLSSLPSAPTTWMAIQARLDDPDASSEEIGELVNGDVAIATKVLQVVNSSFMGVGRPITSVPAAVAYLGLRTLGSMVLSMETIRIFNDAEAIKGFSVEALTRHGQLCAGLARRLSPNGPVSEAAVTAALVQDVGQLLLADAMPDRMANHLATAKQRQLPLHVVEREEIGADHAEVGAYLLGLWGLPEQVVAAVAGTHAPMSALSDVPSAAEVVRTTHALVQLHRPELADPTDRRPEEEWRSELSEAVPSDTLERWALLAVNWNAQE